MKLQAVANQVLKQLTDLKSIGANRRQRADIDSASGLLNQHLEIGNDLVSHRRQVNKHQGVPLRGDPRECEQVVDQVRIRAADLRIRSRYSLPGFPSSGEHLSRRRAAKAWILRSGSWRS